MAWKVYAPRGQGVAVHDCCTAPASSACAPGMVFTHRPSVFQAGYNPSRYKMYERRALSLIAAACRWPLLLLSPLLSAQPRLPGGGPCLTLSVKGACPHDAYEKHCGRRVKTMHEIGE